MSTMNENFAAFILTHGRPDNVKTYRTLRKQGYTGRIVLVVDNEDSSIDEYRERYGDQVVVFDKLAMAQRIDEADNFGNRKAIVYARNASYDIAEQLGIEYFLQLDDDYNQFVHKFTSRLIYHEKPVRDLDRLFEQVLAYYQSIPALTVALAQNGDFIGGAASSAAKAVTARRKAMNALFCSTKRRIWFMGRVNEDVNTYVTTGNRGGLFLTIMSAALIQTQTQQSAGGMSDLYLDEGTYRKSFYSVMYAPSCVHIRQIGYRYRRLHHHVTWESAVPKIIREEHKHPSS